MSCFAVEQGREPEPTPLWTEQVLVDTSAVSTMCQALRREDNDACPKDILLVSMMKRLIREKCRVSLRFRVFVVPALQTTQGAEL